MIKNKQIPKRLINKLEKITASMGWSVSVSNYANGNFIYFSQYSPAGQDFGFEVEAYTLEDLYRAVKYYYDGYDCSEEAVIWLDDSGHGKNGAPYDMKDVYEDMEACEKMVGDLVERLAEAA